jgi:hypothetical protein
MKNGTAKIDGRTGLWVVTWMNVGNFLRNEPRAFWNYADAVQFCRDRGLKHTLVVS